MLTLVSSSSITMKTNSKNLLQAVFLHQIIVIYIIQRTKPCRKYTSINVDNAVQKCIILTANYLAKVLAWQLCKVTEMFWKMLNFSK